MKPPQIQLGLLPGFEGPILPSAPIELEPPKPPRRAVSAERELLAAQRSLAISLDPPDLEGWRDELGRERPRIVNGVCTAIEQWRRLEDGTIGPCPWTGCPRHTLIDHGQIVTIGGQRRAELLLHRAADDEAVGRRPALPVVPTDGEIDAFDAEALKRIDAIPRTCIRDAMPLVADRAEAAEESAVGFVGYSVNGDQVDPASHMADAARVAVIAETLGLSEEQIRLDTISAAAKLGIRLMNGQPVPGDGARVEALLAKLAGRRRVLSDAELAERRACVMAYLGRRGSSAEAIERALLADATPAPVAIRRIERDAPPPREPGADEIFTF